MPANSLGASPFSPRRLSGRFPPRRTGSGADSILVWAESAEAGPPVLIEVFPPALFGAEPVTLAGFAAMGKSRAQFPANEDATHVYHW